MNPFRLFGGAVAMSCALAAVAQAKPEISPFDPVMAKSFTMPRAQPSTSSYLLELGRSAHVNILADATELPPATPPLQGGWKEKYASATDGKWTAMLGDFVLDLAHERQLTWKRHDKSTFLFWKEPDTAALGHAIARSGIELARPDAEWQAQQQSATALSDALNAFYRKEYAFSVASGKVAPDVALSDLPPDLRAAVLRFARFEVERPDNRTVPAAIWLDDAFWARSFLRLQNDNDRQVLMIGGEAIANSEEDQDDPYFVLGEEKVGRAN